MVRLPSAGLPPLPVRLERHLRRSRLLEPGATVTVALSGGVDSAVLLHLLRFGLSGWDVDLAAAHLDHGMRPGSGRDAEWVRGLCRAWEVPLALERVTEPPRSEAEARAARYAFLERVAAGRLIATAHQRDDQAETVLFRMIRGTGLRGLRGIAPRRGRIIRPLLPFGRDEILRHARSSRMAFREDPSNVDLAFARNRLRRVVLPELERARPGAARALAALARDARRAERAWNRLLDRIMADLVIEAGPDDVTLARDLLRSYHPGVRSRVLRHVLRRYGSMPGRAGTHAALKFINTGRSGGELHLPGGVRIERDFERIRVTRHPRSAHDDVVLEIPSGETGGGRAVVGGRVVEVSWGTDLRSEASERAVLPRTAAFPLRLRGWHPGDRIRLSYGGKKLKKLFAERRLDRRARRRAPVLVDAGGRVLWVVGVARAAGIAEDDGGGGFQIAVRDAEQD